MEEIQVREQTVRPAMFHSMPAFSMADDKALSAWRRRGMIETKMIFLFTLTIFVTGIIALLVLYTRTTPPPGSESPDGGRGAYQENIAEESEPEVEWLSSQLKLSGDQAQRIRPLVDQEQRQIDSAVAEESQTSRDRIARVNQIRMGTLESFVPMLSATQNIRLRQLLDEEAAGVRAVWAAVPGTVKQ